MDVNKVIIDLERRLSMVEGELVNLKAAKPATGPSRAVDILPFEMLTRPWANKNIRRDPKFWTGDSFEGQTYSAAPAEYLEKLASSYDYSAKKGRAAETPKCNDKGKPYYESDEFESKLLRTWVAQKKSTAALPGMDDLPGMGNADAEIPF